MLIIPLIGFFGFSPSVELSQMTREFHTLECKTSKALKQRKCFCERTKSGAMDPDSYSITSVVSTAVLGVFLLRQRLRGRGLGGGGPWRFFNPIVVLGVLAWLMFSIEDHNVLRGGRATENSLSPQEPHQKVDYQAEETDSGPAPRITVFFLQPWARCRFCWDEGFMPLSFDPDCKAEGQPDADEATDRALRDDTSDDSGPELGPPEGQEATADAAGTPDSEMKPAKSVGAGTGAAEGPDAVPGAADGSDEGTGKTGGQEAETGAVGGPGPEALAADTRGPETESPESQGAAANAADTSSSETKVVEGLDTGTGAAEGQDTETGAAESKEASAAAPLASAAAGAAVSFGPGTEPPEGRKAAADAAHTSGAEARAAEEQNAGTTTAEGLDAGTAAAEGQDARLEEAEDEKAKAGVPPGETGEGADPEAAAKADSIQIDPQESAPIAAEPSTKTTENARPDAEANSGPEPPLRKKKPKRHKGRALEKLDLKPEEIDKESLTFMLRLIHVPGFCFGKSTEKNEPCLPSEEVWIVNGLVCEDYIHFKLNVSLDDAHEDANKTEAELVEMWHSESFSDLRETLTPYWPRLTESAPPIPPAHAYMEHSNVFQLTEDVRSFRDYLQKISRLVKKLSLKSTLARLEPSEEHPVTTKAFDSVLSDFKRPRLWCRDPMNAENGLRILKEIGVCFNDKFRSKRCPLRNTCREKFLYVPGKPSVNA